MSEAINFLQAFEDNPESVQIKHKRLAPTEYEYPRDEQELMWGLLMINCKVRMAPKPFKPDLSCLVGSDVFCEFWNVHKNQKTIGKLEGIILSNELPFGSTTAWFKHCQPALDLWQVHHGGECPLPEGAIYSIRKYNLSTNRLMEYSNLTDEARQEFYDSQTTAYKFTGWIK